MNIFSYMQIFSWKLIYSSDKKWFFEAYKHGSLRNGYSFSIAMNYSASFELEKLILSIAKLCGHETTFASYQSNIKSSSQR